MNDLFYRAVYFDHIHRFLFAHVPASRVQQENMGWRSKRGASAQRALAGLAQGQRSAASYVFCIWRHQGSKRKRSGVSV